MCGVPRFRQNAAAVTAASTARLTQSLVRFSPAVIPEFFAPASINRTNEIATAPAELTGELTVTRAE
jgi:hypothetical protein